MSAIVESGYVVPGIKRHKNGRTRNHFVDVTEHIQTVKAQGFPFHELQLGLSRIPLFKFSNDDDQEQQFDPSSGKIVRIEDNSPTEKLLAYTHVYETELEEHLPISLKSTGRLLP